MVNSMEYGPSTFLTATREILIQVNQGCLSSELYRYAVQIIGRLSAVRWMIIVHPFLSLTIHRKNRSLLRSLDGRVIYSRTKNKMWTYLTRPYWNNTIQSVCCIKLFRWNNYVSWWWKSNFQKNQFEFLLNQCFFCGFHLFWLCLTIKISMIYNKHIYIWLYMYTHHTCSYKYGYNFIIVYHIISYVPWSKHGASSLLIHHISGILKHRGYINSYSNGFIIPIPKFGYIICIMQFLDQKIDDTFHYHRYIRLNI